MTETHDTLQLPNGLTVVAEQLPAVRSAAFQLLVPAGATTDPEGAEGSAGVLEGLCYRGAGDRDSRALSDALDSLGVQRSGGAELEYTSLGAALLADDLISALALYADVVRRPHLHAEHFAAEKALALQRLERLEDSPTEKLFVHLRRSYFSSPHGRSTLGKAEDLKGLTVEALRADHHRRFTPQGSILAIAGRYDWGRLVETIHQLFGDWSGGENNAPEPSNASRPRYLHLHQDTNQEQIGLLFPSIPLEHPEYYFARMAVRVLSGGMGARLFTEIREKHGLCYSVSAFHTTVKHQGHVGAYSGTTPERCPETLRLLLHELRRLSEGVTEEELKRARTGVLSDLVMSSEAARARTSVIARDQFLIGRTRTLREIRAGVEAVTTDGLRDFLQRHPAGDWTVATLGPVELEVPA